MRKFLLIPVLLFCASVSRAGTCPSGTNYLTPSGAATTLTSLGVTSCFFIAANGLDTNTGADETHPWLHSPGMPNCTSACATEWDALSAGTTGVGFIFRGGDTWHEGNSGATPYTGRFTSGNGSLCDAGNSCGLVMGGNHSGTGNPWLATLVSPIYFGVDLTWFSGASWVRPILTGDNATSGTAVGSCTFDSSALSLVQSWSRSSGYFIDDLEWTGSCWTGTHASATAIDIGNHVNTTFTNRIIMRNYIHGWTHVAFNCPSTVCNGFTAISGPSQSTFGGGDTIAYNVIDGSDTDQVSGDALTFGGFDIHGNFIGHMAGGIITNQTHTLHDNLFDSLTQDADGVSHTNIAEFNNEWATGPNTVYNNVARNSFVSGAGEFFQMAPNTGQTDYFFNNVMYGMSTNANWLDFCGGAGVGSGCGQSGGTINIFNNTWVLPFSGSANGGPGAGSTANLINNHIIVPGGGSGNSGYVPVGGTVNATTNLYQTPAQATTAGYASSTVPAYAPQTGASSTVGVGTNESSFCTTLTGSSDALIQAAGVACLAGTGYACTYNSSVHTMTCPAFTSASRGTTWDAGAFEFPVSGGGGGVSAAPTFSPSAGTYLTPQIVTITSSTGGATICYTNDGTTPTTNGAGVCIHGTFIANGGSVSVSFSQLLQAIASESGFTDSTVSSAQYTFPTSSPGTAFAGIIIPVGTEIIQ